MTHSDALALINQTVDQIKAAFPQVTWEIEFSGSLTFKSWKGRWGDADKSGNIRLHQLFLEDLSEDSHNKMRDTICHELCHLMVGLHHHHDKTFKLWFERIKRALGVKAPQTANRAVAARNITSKYTLFASLVDGRRVKLGEFNRRDSKKVNNPNRYYWKGVKVAAFDYVLN